MELIVRNATLVTPTETFRADLAVARGIIQAIGTPGSIEHAEAEKAEQIDGEGCYLLPGAIDVHTHFQLPMGDTVSADDFYSGTVAAAAGGVTTVIDFATHGPHETVKEAIEARRLEADGKAVLDYSFHAGITRADEATLAEIQTLPIPSLKLFMAYAMRLEDDDFLRILETAKAAGALAGVHAENGLLVDALRERFIKEGKTEPLYHYLSRPALVEAEAVSRALRLARLAEAPLYVFHLASGEALDEIAHARRQGHRIFAETCPHYLLHTADRYREPGGERFILSPPMKEESDRQRLWQGLANREIDVVATDHCPFMRAEKAGPFHQVPNGMGGTEVLLPLLYSEGVAKNRLTLNRLVEVLAANPARIFGLPGKGNLAPGMDADFLLLDPRGKKTITAAEQFSRCDYSPYEGWSLEGAIRMVFSGGRVLFREGRFVGDQRGRFLPRTR